MSTQVKIKLNDILRLSDLDKVRIRFNIHVGGESPIDLFSRGTNNAKQIILNSHHWNDKSKVYQEGFITVGFIPMTTFPDDRWLLVFVGRITKDLDILNGIGYEYEKLPEYDCYIGRLVVHYHNKSQKLVRIADNGFMDHLIVESVLPEVYEVNPFPGYDNVNISWRNLAVAIKKDSWKTALQNQKGVYLLTDRNTGKMYVGAAYGKDMILGRWESYLKTGHGNDKELLELSDLHGIDYFKNNFWFSILEIFKGTTNDKIIRDREAFWKEVLMTRSFGYNAN